MVVNCEEVWREVSNYLDGEVEPGLRAAMEEHVRGCKRCTAVLDGTRNVIQLYGDERMLEVPLIQPTSGTEVGRKHVRQQEKLFRVDGGGGGCRSCGWSLRGGAFVWIKSAEPALGTSSTGRRHTPGHDGGR